MFDYKSSALPTELNWPRSKSGRQIAGLPTENQEFFANQALGQAGMIDTKKGLRWGWAFLDSRRANGFALG